MDTDNVLRSAELEVRGAIRSLQTIEVTSLLEAKIIAELATGSRTVAELTCQVFETDSCKPQYSAYYDRVRRSLRVLEGRGYVARRLFGREKPYRLTKLAVGSLLAFDRKPTKENWPDYLAFSAFATLAGGVVALAAGQAPHPIFLSIYSAFLITTGVVTCRIVQILREVM